MKKHLLKNMSKVIGFALITLLFFTAFTTIDIDSIFSNDTKLSKVAYAAAWNNGKNGTFPTQLTDVGNFPLNQYCNENWYMYMSDGGSGDNKNTANELIMDQGGSFGDRNGYHRVTVLLGSTMKEAVKGGSFKYTFFGNMHAANPDINHITMSMVFYNGSTSVDSFSRKVWGKQLDAGYSKGSTDSYTDRSIEYTVTNKTYDRIQFEFRVDKSSTITRHMDLKVRNHYVAVTAVTKASNNLSISAANQNYNGSAYLSSNLKVLTNTSNGIISYAYKVQGAADSTYTSTVPTNAGNYTVRATSAATSLFNAATATADFIISKINNTLIISAANVTYNGNSYSSVSITTNISGGSVSYQYKIRGAADSTYTTTAPTDAGMYTAKATSAATTNYNSASVTADFTINKANNTLAVSISDIIYGQTLDIVVVTNTSGGAITYHYKAQGASDSTYTTTAPVIVGKYTLRATSAETTNYLSASYTINYDVKKATFNMSGTIWSHASPYTYDRTAKTVTVINLPEGVTVKSYTNNTATSAGNYSATVSFDYDETNYNQPTIAALNWIINKRPITISATDIYKTYSFPDPILTYSVTMGNIVSEDTLSGGLIRVSGENTGSYAIRQGTLNNENYAITFIEGTFTINHKNIIGNVFIAEINSVYYIAQAYMPTPTVNDISRGVQLVNNNEISYSYVNNINAGTATVTVNGIGNYTGSIDVNFIINKSDVNITANNITKTYGDSLANADISGTSKNASDTSVNVAGAWSFVTGINENPLCENSGNYIVKFVPSDTANYNIPSTLQISLTVNRKTLTISGVYGVNKVYDTNTLIPLAGGALQGLVYSDVITFTLGTANTPSADAGSYTLLGVDIKVSGERVANYNFIQPTVTTTILPKNIDGNVTVADIPFYYYTANEITPTPDVLDIAFGLQLVDGTDIVYTYENNISATKAAIVYISGVGNYTGQIQTTFVIKKISVLISADDIIKTYGESLGESDVGGTALNANVNEINVDGIWSFVSAYNPNPLCQDSGIYTVRFRPFETDNYEDPDDTTLTLTVNRRDITITGVQGVTRPFNGYTAINLAGGTLQNLVYDDEITFTLGTANSPSPNVGNYIAINLNIQIHGEREANYRLVQPADAPITIVPKEIAGAVTVADIAPHNYTTLEITPTPAVTDNAISVNLVNNLDLTYSYHDNINTGTASITITGKGNYTGSVQTTFTILKSDIIITANTIIKTYGDSLGNLDITGTAKNANNNSVNVAGAFVFSDAFNPNPLVSDSGLYQVKYLPSDSNNYNISPNFTITVTVNKKVITITDVYAINREYDGCKIVELAGGVLHGLAYSDTIVIIPGKASIIAKDIGNYNVSDINITLGGERANNYLLIQPEGIGVTILPKNLNNATDIYSEQVTLVYNGNYHMPTPWVADSIQDFVLGIDFEYGIYEDNLFAGRASIQIIGKGNYSGTNYIYFTIDKRTINIIYSNYEGLVYTSYAHTVSAYASNLVFNIANDSIDAVNLTVSGESNTEAGNHIITVVSLDNPNYKLPQINWLQYTIAPKDIALARVAYMDSVVYTGFVIRRTPAVTDQQRGVGLLQGTDYTYGYGGPEDNINAIDGSDKEGFVIISGIGNYTGTQIAYFDITPKLLSISGAAASAIVEAIGSHIYTGFQIQPEPGVYDIARSADLIKNVDFIYQYGSLQDNINVITGSLIEGTVYIVGKGNYMGSVAVSFNIDPKTITLDDVTVAQIAPQEYSGYRHTPEPAILDIDRAANLIKNVDFSYIYGTNIDCTTSGTAEGSVTVTGMNNYSGSITVNFDILPKTITANITSYDLESNLVNYVYNGKTQEVFATPVGCVQRDLDNSTLPVFNIAYLNGKPLNVPADGSNYPVVISLDRNRFPNYNMQQIELAVKVSPKPIEIVFENHNGLVYDGTPKQISVRFANQEDICKNDYGRLDTLSILLSNYYYTPYIGESAEVTEVLNAGYYTIVASLSVINYRIANESTLNFVLNRKNIIVKAEDRSKFFGDEDNISTHFTQRVNSGTTDGDIFVVLMRDKDFDNVLDYESAGSYPYTGIEEHNNYKFELAENSGKFHINKRTISVIPRKHAKTYGDADPIDISQILNSYYDIRIVFNFVRQPGENVGVYAVDTNATTLSYLRYDGDEYIENSELANNFRLAEYDTQEWFTITKRQIDVYMGEFEKVYGSPDPSIYTYEVDVANLAEWDKEFSKEELFLNYIVTREKGEDVKSNGYGLTLDLGNNNYEARMNGPARLMIRKMVIADAFDLTQIFNISKNKIYDGTIKANVITNLPNILKKTGFGVTATFSQKDAGTNLTINLVYKINSSAKVNFDIPADAVITGCEIIRRTLTASFIDSQAAMVYGESLPTFQLRYSGFLSGDNEESVGINAIDVDYGVLSCYSGVGLYTVTLCGKTEYTNYILDLSATATVKVNPASLELRAGTTYIRSVDNNQSRECKTLTPDYHYYFVGLLNNDCVVLDCFAYLDNGAPGATKLRLTNLKIDSLNYVLTTTSVVIDAIIKPLPEIDIKDASFDYDGCAKSIVPTVKVDNVPIYEYLVTYLGEGYEETTVAPVNAGTYTVKVITTSTEYDSKVNSATLTIRKVVPKISITGTLTQIYGNFKPLTAIVTGPNFEENLNIDYPFEIINGRANAGAYTVKVGFEGNRNFYPVSAEQTSVTLTIMQKAISATFYGYRNLTYNGQEQPISAAFDGVLDGDIANALIDYGGQRPLNAGTYAVTVYTDNQNYKIVGTTSLTFTIAKRSLRVYVKSGTFVDNTTQYELDFEGFAEGDNPESLQNIPTARLQSMLSGDNEVMLYGGVDPNYEIVLDNESNAKVTIIHQPKSQGGGNTIFIILGVIGGVAVVIALIAIINARKAKKAMFN